MDANAPGVLFIPIDCASKKAPCPKCGKKGKRVRVHERQVRTIAYKQVAYLQIRYGEYAARCQCCKTFCNSPEGVLQLGKTEHQVRGPQKGGTLE